MNFTVRFSQLLARSIISSMMLDLSSLQIPDLRLPALGAVLPPAFNVATSPGPVLPPASNGAAGPERLPPPTDNGVFSPEPLPPPTVSGPTSQDNLAQLGFVEFFNDQML